MSSSSFIAYAERPATLYNSYTRTEKSLVSYDARGTASVLGTLVEFTQSGSPLRELARSLGLRTTKAAHKTRTGTTYAVVVQNGRVSLRKTARE
jgi:hypothetical protein